MTCPSTQSSRTERGFASRARSVSLAELYQVMQAPEKPQQCLPAIVHQEGLAECLQFPPLSSGMHCL